RAQRLSSAMLAVNAAESTETMLQAIATQVRELLEAGRGVAWIRDDGHRRLALAGAASTDSGDRTTAGPGLDSLLEAAAAESILRLEGEALATHPPLAPELSRLVAEARPRRWLSVPLLRRDGSRLGVVAAWDGEPGGFGEDGEALAASFAEGAALALQDLLFREARS